MLPAAQFNTFLMEQDSNQLFFTLSSCLFASFFTPLHSLHTLFQVSQNMIRKDSSIDAYVQYPQMLSITTEKAIRLKVIPFLIVSPIDHALTQVIYLKNTNKQTKPQHCSPLQQQAYIPINILDIMALLKIFPSFIHIIINHNYFYIMKSKEQPIGKSLNEYDQLKDSRHKNLIKEFQDFLLKLKMSASLVNAQKCRKQSIREGELDQIDEKVCLKAKQRELNVTLIRILPELTQHANNYEQCLKECAKNHISYIVANQSCKAVYEKNFNSTTKSIADKLLG